MTTEHSTVIEGTSVTITITVVIGDSRLLFVTIIIWFYTITMADTVNSPSLISSAVVLETLVLVSRLLED
jgi:hypothetical protein